MRKLQEKIFSQGFHNSKYANCDHPLGKRAKT